jgi:hypothetical protein
MFDRLKKAFSKEAAKPEDAPPSSQLTAGPASEWAMQNGVTMSFAAGGKGPSMQGKVGGRLWRMEVGRPSRNYIAGEELRGRAELGINEDMAALVINRPLKDALEKKAYSMITDTLQTTADPNLPEEMRWLAMYDEVGWDALPATFWNRYAVLADAREHALAWMEGGFAELLMAWPAPAPTAQVPFIVALMRGKCYLRMEYQPAGQVTMEHAAKIFTAACESALVAFPKE